MRRLLAVLALFLATCSAEPIGNGPRREVLVQVAERVIEPTYAEVELTATALDTEIHTFVAAPDAAGLEAVRAAWRAARKPWMQSQAFRFGPVKELVLDARMDQWPTDATALAAILADAEPITTERVRGLGANKRGYHALEVLLFVPPEGSDVLTAFTSEPRRRDLLVALAEDLALSATTLHDAWAAGYLAQFIGVGDDAAVFQSIKAAIDGLINESVFLAENITDTKLGKPLGLATGGPVRPDLLESPSSDESLADIEANLGGIDNVWRGSRDGSLGLGLRSIVLARSPAIAVQVDSDLDAARAAVAAVPRPLATALAGDNAKVMAAWEAVRSLRLTLTVDVVGVLGATLSFNDNDGD